jgi:2-phosphosulfolactate phosphatase
MDSSSVIIDYLPESASQYLDDYSIVCIDVFRATTTILTALSLGREVYPVATTDEALELAKNLKNPLLVGEQGGNIPYGFDLTNSPVQVIALSAVPSGNFTLCNRELILLSSSGTRLIKNSAGAAVVYVACMRNLTAMADFLADNSHKKVAILGAGTRGDFRREDQMCCAWLAEKLQDRGYSAQTEQTSELINKWSGKDMELARHGRSADYLNSSGQVHDMEFILHHFDDLDIISEYKQDKFIVINGSIRNQHPW